MLDILRKKKRSWIITMLLGIIIIVFVAFYGGTKLREPGSEDIAEVNGEAITQREFAMHYQKLLERYRELFKGSLNPELVKSLNLKSSLLEELIQRKLVLQEARDLGLATSDEDLMNAIAQVPEFQVNGRFNKERYIQLLRANRLTPAQFETEQREQLTMQRLYGVIADSVHVTEAEVRDRYRIEQEKINLYFIKLPASSFVAEVKATEEEVKTFYDRNKESLKEPLRVQVEYLSYPFALFSAPVEISQKEIEDYYTANREAKFHKPKEARLRYVSIRVEQGTDAKTKEAARTRAKRIVEEARAGKDFAQLARQESDDPSAAKGGDIGWVVQGQLPPPLDKAIFALAKGKVSDVIETPTGLHIVKIEETKAEKTQSLEEASGEIVRTIKADKGKKEAGKVADRDREKALSGSDFSKLSQESGVPLKVTGWFTSSEVLPEIGQVQEFYKSALSLGAKELSPVIEGTNAYYLIRLKQRKEATVPPLENVRSNIEKRLKESKALELLVQKANGLLEQLKKEKDIRKLAREHSLSLEETGWFLRSAPELPKVGQLQEIRAGGIAISAEKPIPERIFTQRDAAFLFAFKESQGADMARFEKEKDRFMKEALAENRQRVLQRFVDGLKGKAKIQVQTQLLEES